MRISVQIEFDKVKDFETPKNNVVVGRSQDCDIIISHHSVSRQHCRIEYVEEEKAFYITDLKSFNGVSLDGQKINPQERTSFNPKRHLSLGHLSIEVGLSSKINPELGIRPDQEVLTGVREARIDIDREVISTRKVSTEAPRVKGPRNPILDQEKDQTENTYLNKKLIFIFLLLGSIAAYVYWVFSDLAD